MGAHRLAKVFRDERGVSAVEFAFIAPILVLVYFGLAEITLAMMAERRASHAASAVGDLVAQSKASIPSSAVDQMMNIGTSSVKPYSTTKLSMRVTSVLADPDGVAIVAWSKAQGPDLTKLNQDDPVAGFPANLIAPGETVIMSDVVYGYETPLKKIINRELHFRDTYYLRPRRADAILCPDCPP
jgi:Flp pilus assembly protein TadG